MIDPLLPELVAIQHRERYLPHEALVELSERLHIPLNRIYSVASFYQAFRFTPSGKHHIKVCVGAACYVKGAEPLYDAFFRYLNIPEGSDTSPDGLYTLSKVSCLGCCMLAVAVQIDRHIFGHVTPELVPNILRDFQLFSQEDAELSHTQDSSGDFRGEVRICRCSSCRAAGSARIYKTVAHERKSGGFDFAVKEVGCHGMSYRAPLVTVVAEDAVYHYDQVREHDIRSIVSSHFTPDNRLRQVTWKGKVLLDKFYRRKNAAETKQTILSETVENTRLITRNSGMTHPESLDEYRQVGGFVAFEKAKTMPPEKIIEILKTSKLRGRGGGGFPTGEKWRLAHEATGDVKIVICNADEGDPGAFMDRMLLESFPYRVLEGILIASLMLQAKTAVIYIREEYTQAITVVEKVIASMKKAGYFQQIGDDFEIQLFRGAGAFVCGEETALLESIQGNRGVPRVRPPFPVTSGLCGVPTLINNVETFACVPIVLADDGQEFRTIGTERSHGTKAFALAGKIRQGGLIEVPIGIEIEGIVENFGGGAEENHAMKAVMIGGPSGGCIPRKRFSLPVDYETLQTHGAMMGSGGLVVLDERDCMVDLSLYYLRFLRNESCGKCVPCREGIVRLCDLVEQLTRDGTKDADLLEKIELLARSIQQGALCALGRTAPNMVLSALYEIRSEFEAHLQNACPAGKCTELTEFRISPERCIGCTKCVQACATDAIECVILERAEINPEKCVKCGVCRSVCPQGAIVNIHDVPVEEKEMTLPVYRPCNIEGDVIEIDGTPYPFRPGQTLLDYASEHGWEIPTLCHLKGIQENAHCMVCAIWDATLGRFVPACEQTVERGHVYELQGEHVTAFRRESLALMLYRHDFHCGKCTAKGNCRFFDLLREYGVKKAKNPITFPEKIEAGHITHEAGKCILCHRCLRVSQGHLTMHDRAERSHVSPSPNSWGDIPFDVACDICDVCPTGALRLTKTATKGNEP